MDQPTPTPLTTTAHDHWALARAQFKTEAEFQAWGLKPPRNTHARAQRYEIAKLRRILTERDQTIAELRENLAQSVEQASAWQDRAVELEARLALVLSTGTAAPALEIQVAA